MAHLPNPAGSSPCSPPGPWQGIRPSPRLPGEAAGEGQRQKERLPGRLPSAGPWASPLLHSQVLAEGAASTPRPLPSTPALDSMEVSDNHGLFSLNPPGLFQLLSYLTSWKPLGSRAMHSLETIFSSGSWARCSALLPLPLGGLSLVPLAESRIPDCP